MFTKTVLSNGLRIITVPLRGAKTVTILLMVKTGSVYEKEKENGISHFLEHMLFKGTKKRPRTIDIARELDSIGAKFNAFTDKEAMVFYTTVINKHLDTGLDVLSDMFLNSKLEEKEMEREKKVIIEEIEMIRDNPMRYIDDLWESLLYGNQPAGWEIAGTKEIIKSISKRMLKNYYLDQFVAKNTIVALAGDIESSEIIDKIKNYLEGINIGLPRQIPKTLQNQSAPNVLINFKETDQSHLVLGVRAYSIFHPQRYALDILAVILGGNMSSRLFTSIRERRGLAYYVSTSSVNYNDRGYLATSAGVKHQKLDLTIKLILKEYKKIVSDVSHDELEKAKEFLKGRLAIELEGPDDYASFFGGEEIATGNILTPEQKCAKIDEVSLSDIKKVAEDIFQPKNLNLAIIGPHKDKTKFDRILNI